MSWVFGAFTFAYAVFEIPSGRLGDWIGPRKVLTRIVLWWSAFTAAPDWPWNYHGSLLATRFLFGVGEAGPSQHFGRVSRWLPEPGARPGSRCPVFRFANWRRRHPSAGDADSCLLRMAGFVLDFRRAWSDLVCLLVEMVRPPTAKHPGANAPAETRAAHDAPVLTLMCDVSSWADRETASTDQAVIWSRPCLRRT